MNKPSFFHVSGCLGCMAECTPSWKEYCDIQFDAIGNRDGFYIDEKPQRIYGFGEDSHARPTEKDLSFIQRYEELSKFGLGLHE